MLGSSVRFVCGLNVVIKINLSFEWFDQDSLAKISGPVGVGSYHSEKNLQRVLLPSRYLFKTSLSEPHHTYHLSFLWRTWMTEFFYLTRAKIEVKGCWKDQGVNNFSSILGSYYIIVRSMRPSPLGITTQQQQQQQLVLYINWHDTKTNCQCASMLGWFHCNILQCPNSMMVGMRDKILIGESIP